ncbi:MAG: glycosyl transferase family 4 [Nanoarchaeota archaeon]|nr:glycosyl transferase family 4 [Nanoarchaeota archaeon]
MLESMSIGIVILVAFAITVFLIPKYIKRAKAIDLVGKDMNKYDKPEIAEAGGVVVLFGFLFAILCYIFIKTFFLGTEMHLIEILVISVTILLAGFIGFVDDIFGWKKGLKRWQKPLFTLPMAIPLMVINAGQSYMFLPFLGRVDFGLLFPLIIIPLGFIGATNGFNMLAGYNGIEAGMGAIILATMGFIAWYFNSMIWLAMVSFVGVAALLGFLAFNWCPAKVFPGDSLTYMIGAFIASVAIMGNMEKIGIILFLPFLLDAVLSLSPEVRGKGKVEAFGKVNPDNSLDMPYDGVYDTTHLAIKVMKKLKSKVYEKDVTLFIYFLELIMVVLVFAFFI